MHKNSTIKESSFESIKVSACASCNGACCMYFALPYGRLEALRKRIDRKLPLSKLISNTLKDFILLKRVSKKTAKRLGAYAYGGVLYSCRALIKGKCAIYRFSPDYCKRYNCYGKKQLAHDLGVPQLNQTFEDRGEECSKELSE